MEAWNIYLAILIDHSPACAPQLVAYQRIITSASINYLFATWLNYDVQFGTLAASDPSLHWDVHHTDLWLQWLPLPQHFAGLIHTEEQQLTTPLIVLFATMLAQYLPVDSKLLLQHLPVNSSL